MQSESSSCITGVCVLFVYLVFTKGTHHITEVTAVCLKRAGAGARGERGCGESAMPSLGCCCLFCFLSFFFFLLSFFILSFFFFLFSFLFFFGGVTNTYPETLQDCFIAVGWLAHSYLLWDICLYVCLSGCAASRRVRGISLATLPGCLSLSVAQLEPGPAMGSVLLASLAEFGRRVLALMWQLRRGEGSSHKRDGVCYSS